MLLGEYTLDKKMLENRAERFLFNKRPVTRLLYNFAEIDVPLYAFVI